MFDYVRMSESTSDIAQALRQRAAALAILECAVTREMVAQQSELRLRAERRAGLVLKAALEAAVRQRDLAAFELLLDAHGISRHQASRWQGLACLTADMFERKVVKRVAIAVAGMTNDTLARAG
jgi:hypothetical protein